MVITQKSNFTPLSHYLPIFKQILAHFKNTSGSLRIRHTIFIKIQKVHNILRYVYYLTQKLRNLFIYFSW